LVKKTDSIIRFQHFAFFIFGLPDLLVNSYTFELEHFYSIAALYTYLIIFINGAIGYFAASNCKDEEKRKSHQMIAAGLLITYLMMLTSGFMPN
jgi:low temperature requirement protein LtrA